MSIARHTSSTVQPQARRQRTFALRPLGMLAGIVALAGCRTFHRHAAIDAVPFAATGTLYASERLGLVEEARAHGIPLQWNGPADGDIQRQIDMISVAIEQNSYGIVLDPGTMYASAVAISSALAHDIPVVVLLHPLRYPPGPHLSYILEDVDEGGKLAALRLHEQSDAAREVILLGPDSLTPGGAERFRSVESALQTSAPKARIVDRISGPSSAGYFETELERSLGEHPKVTSIVSLNSAAGFAAAAVVRSLHLERQVRIVTFDQTIELLLLLRRNEIDAIVAPDARRMGRMAVDQIVADHQNVARAPYSYVKPILVTRENIDTEEVQQALRMN